MKYCKTPYILIMKCRFQFLMTMIFRYIPQGQQIHVLWIIKFVMDWWSGNQIWLFNQFFNHYKAVAYMCACQNLKSFSCNAFEKELNKYEQMKSLANAYINKRKCSIQECVYHILPGQWLRKTFPHLIFANSNIPEKTFPFA